METANDASLFRLVENIRATESTGNSVVDTIFQPFFTKNQYVEILQGWDFREETVSESIRTGSLFHADIDTPFKNCRLSCEYCFVRGDKRYKHQTMLTMPEWSAAMKDLAAEGLKSVKIVGQGEVTEDPAFLKYLTVLSDLGVHAIVFTAGYVFGDDEICTSIHHVGARDLIKETLDLGTSVMVKFDSPRSDIQDRIVRSSGYAKKRNTAIVNFLEHGNLTASNQSRFGLEVNLGAHNAQDIYSIYALRFLAGIYPDICLSMVCDSLDGLMTGSRISGLTHAEIEDVFAGILFVNSALGIRDYGVSPFFGVLKCAHVSLGSLYLTGGGDIYFSCCGNTRGKIGNYREMGIPAARQQALRLRESYNLPVLHDCPFRLEAGFLDDETEFNVMKKVDALIASHSSYKPT